MFSPDSKWIFWVRRDVNSRPTQVLRRNLRAGADTLVYREEAPDFLMTVTGISSGRYVMIRSWNATSSEV